MKSLYALAILGCSVTILAAYGHIRNTPPANANLVVSTAFEDGIYLGALAAGRGESPHIAIGRWATANDRQLFNAGYMESYKKNLALMVREKSNTQRNGSAAYSDGLYLGRLDAMQERAEHIDSARWAQLQDREFFTQGYLQAYADTTAARARKIKETVQALSVR